MEIILGIVIVLGIVVFSCLAFIFNTYKEEIWNTIEIKDEDNDRL